MKKIVVILLVILMSISICIPASSHSLLKKNDGETSLEDFDPLVDVSVTVYINQIRSLITKNLCILPIDKIDWLSDPDFYIKVIINDEEFSSPTWQNMNYVNDPDWSATLNVPDDVEFVNITIQLWDDNLLRDQLCDISGNSEERPDSSDIIIQYSIKTGHWTGEDYVGEFFWGGPDPSGYGRANGCDDNSIYQNDRDCELWFDITQTDPDGDSIPYWTEMNIFHTDPTVNNANDDPNHDGIPLSWDYKWGFAQSFRHGPGGHSFGYNWTYNPFFSFNYSNLDPDNDGLTNYEEYLTSQWGSDPFRKDIFMEMDQMQEGPNGEPASIFPEGAKELLRTAYDKHNIVYHLDDGTWESGTGSEMIPFDELTESSWGGGNTTNELQQIYIDYFLHNSMSNWRRGVFHYGVVIYQCSVANGNAFNSNAFQISSQGLNNKTKSFQTYKRDIVYASAYMHETGHTLNIANPGVDNSNSKFIYQLGWWQWRHYKSVMNYGHMFTMVDYSDGSRGINDFDDWNTLDLTYFQGDFF